LPKGSFIRDWAQCCWWQARCRLPSAAGVPMGAKDVRLRHPLSPPTPESLFGDVLWTTQTQPSETMPTATPPPAAAAMSVKETRRSAIKHWPTAGALENSSQRQKSRWPMVVATVREGECHGTHTKIVQRGAHAEMHTLIGTQSRINIDIFRGILDIWRLEHFSFCERLRHFCLCHIVPQLNAHPYSNCGLQK
jgi:hypothetical protein